MGRFGETVFDKCTADKAESPLIQLGRVKSLRILVGFTRDPVAAADRHIMPVGRAVELTGIGKGPRQLFVCDPEINRNVMLNSKTMQNSGLWRLKGEPGSALENLRAYQPLKNHGSEQAAFHELIDPSLNRAAINRKFGDIRSLITSEMESWKPGVHDFYKLARLCTERVAFNLIFGEESTKFSELGDLLHEHHLASWSLAAHIFRVDLPLTAYRVAVSRAEALQNYIYSLIKLPRHIETSDLIFQRLLKARESDGCPYSEPKVAGMTAMLSWVAYETMATALSWTVFLLAQHPAILADLIDELSAHDSIQDIDANGLLSLPLLDAVIKESMRLIVPVPNIRFKLAEERDIAGQRFASGSRVNVVAHLTHRLPELYTAPDRFRPGRWFSIDPSAYEYMPFGSGQRRCPGAWLAMMNIKVVLAAMFARFLPRIPAGARFDHRYAIVTMPKNGLPIELVPKDGNLPLRVNGTQSGSIFNLFTPEPGRSVQQ